MSKVIHIESGAEIPDNICEEAALWVVRLNTGASAEEHDALGAWLDQDPTHLRALLQVASIWDQASVLSELANLYPLRQYQTPRSTPRWRQGLVFMAAAAVLLLCLQTLPGSWPDKVGFDAGPQPATIQVAHETVIGQQSNVELPDGSIVLLNTDSRIEAAFDVNSRSIVLQRGEAYFTVTSDVSRPFRVWVNGSVAEAVGTEFSVRDSLQGGLEVTVVEGVVNVTPATESENSATSGPSGDSMTRPVVLAPSLHEPIAVGAGEWLQIRKNDASVRKQTIPPGELQRMEAWRKGLLLFQGNTLEEVVREASRYTSIRIDVDEAIRDIEVAGIFRIGDINGILVALQSMLDIDVERLSDDHFMLRRGD